MVFIATGAVGLETAVQIWRASRGEMCGEIAILMLKARRAEARAIAPKPLLVLEAPRFRRLLDRSTTLWDMVRASVEKRGNDPDDLFAKSAEWSSQKHLGSG